MRLVVTRGSARTNLRRLGRSLLDTISPNMCLGCDAAQARRIGLCHRCLKRCRPHDQGCLTCGRKRPARPEAYVPRRRCPSCLERPPELDALYWLGLYEEPLRSVLQALKFQGLSYLGRQIGELLYDEFLYDVDHVDSVTYIPLDPLRYFLRGFNQAEALARPLARRLDRPLLATLRRRRMTRQSRLTGAARARNARRSFRLRTRAPIVGRTILLVDDVVTTGSTLGACARLLKRGGAARVEALVVAHAGEL